MPHRLTTLMILLALLLAPARAIHAQSVIIAELSAQSEAVEDEDGHDPDWLELLNISDQPQPLAGWYLTDDDRNLTRWQLPDVTLVPGARLLIFASGKDRRDPSAPLHTNF